MKAKKIKDFLDELEKEGYNLNKIEVNINLNWEIEPARIIEEDLFDSKTNSILTDIIIKA